MINDLFINCILLISITFITGHILKDIPGNFIYTLHGKLVLGLCGGFIGILLMIYAIQIKGTTTLIDLRIFAMMMASYIGGVIPTIASGIIIGIYRVIFFGVNISSIIAIAQILLYIICYRIIDRKNIKQWKKWFLKSFCSLVILLIGFIYLLRNVPNVHIILLQFTLVIIFISILEFILLEYVRESNELYRRYKKDSTKDFLTGLYNTRQFDSLINSAFNKVIESGGKLACLMIDIDHFKKINDTYGHNVGDIVLKNLASLLTKNCKDYGVVARVGGEEFCILLFDCSKNLAFEIGMRINQAVQKHKFMINKDKFINITVSIGVAVYPDTTSNLEDIKEIADQALYDAKHSGRNKVCAG